MKRAYLALLVVSATVAAALAAPAPALAERPNIERVAVSENGEGRLTFEIFLARPVILDLDDTIQVAIDADRDHGTGVDGLEYSLDWTGYSAVLLTAVDGSSVPSEPATLRFASSGGPNPFTFSAATFSIASAAIGDPERFDFYVFIDRDGEVDKAPSHVLVPTEVAPWTYPKEGKRVPGKPYPEEVYVDGSDFNFPERGLAFVAAIAAPVLGLGALLAVSGWGVERLRRRRKRQAVSA